MAVKQITERQHYWLNHIRTVDAGNETTVEYAHRHGLKVKDLYQWKTKLIKLGLYSVVNTAPSFVPVTTQTPISSSRTDCTVIFPNGLRLEFQGELSPGVIREVVMSASELG